MSKQAWRPAALLLLVFLIIVGLSVLGGDGRILDALAIPVIGLGACVLIVLAVFAYHRWKNRVWFQAPRCGRSVRAARTFTIRCRGFSARCRVDGDPFLPWHWAAPSSCKRLVNSTLWKLSGAASIYEKTAPSIGYLTEKNKPCFAWQFGLQEEPGCKSIALQFDLQEEPGCKSIALHFGLHCTNWFASCNANQSGSRG
jgi:hypothetical protein